MSKKIHYIFLFFFTIILNSVKVSAQDDLLKSLGGDDEKARPVTAMFKCNRLVNGHSTETVAKNHLDFKIHHRFGAVNSGAYNFFGLDGAALFLGFEYGVTKNLSVGIARSNTKLFTGYLKYKIFTQKDGGKGSFPFSISYMTNTGLNSVTWKEQGVADSGRTNYFSSRMSYVNQLLIARKINKNISLQIAPTVFHQNLVKNTDEPNDLYYMGLGGSFKLTRSTRFNVEWFPALNKYKPNGTTNPLSFCFDIETGGHVFQLILSNTQGMVENQFLSSNGTTGKWMKGDIYFGFNLLRYFAL